MHVCVHVQNRSVLRMFVFRQQSSLECQNTSDNIKNNMKHCNLKAIYYQPGENNFKFDKMIANIKKKHHALLFYPNLVWASPYCTWLPVLSGNTLGKCLAHPSKCRDGLSVWKLLSFCHSWGNLYSFFFPL